MLDATFFRKVGPEIRDLYRTAIFENAKDVFGKPFKAYTSKYGQNKRANKFKRQASQYANTNAPVLTSDLLRDYSLIKTMRNGFQIGWTKSQPMPQGVIVYLNSQANRYIKKRLGPNKTTRYKIGRK